MRKSSITFILSIIVAFITSCREDNNKLYILFDNVDGLATGSAITIDGMRVGKIEKMELFKNQVLATAIIDDEIKIPIHSTFTIQQVDLFGQKEILVDFEESTEYYSSRDTVQGELQPSFFSDSANVERLNALIDTLEEDLKEYGKRLKNKK